MTRGNVEDFPIGSLILAKEEWKVKNNRVQLKVINYPYGVVKEHDTTSSKPSTPFLRIKWFKTKEDALKFSGESYDYSLYPESVELESTIKYDITFLLTQLDQLEEKLKK